MSNRDELIEEAKAFCYRYPNPPENWDIRGISATMVDFALDHANRENTRLCLLLADIRTALGDNGKRMQDELVEYCKEIREKAEADRWIPVSERLPDLGDCYMTTQDLEDGEGVMSWPLHYDANSKRWFQDIDHKEPFNNPVLAWQERPAPYLEQAEGGEE